MRYRYGTVESMEMLEDALDAAGIAWWVMELPSGVVFFSPNKIEMLGFDRDENTQFVHYTSFTNRLHPDDRDACIQAMVDHTEGKVPFYEKKYRIKTKDGGYAVVYDCGRVVARTGDEIIVAGAVIDMTNRSELNRPLDP